MIKFSSINHKIEIAKQTEVFLFSPLNSKNLIEEAEFIIQNYWIQSKPKQVKIVDSSAVLISLKMLQEISSSSIHFVLK